MGDGEFEEDPPWMEGRSRGSSDDACLARERCVDDGEETFEGNVGVVGEGVWEEVPNRLGACSA